MKKYILPAVITVSILINLAIGLVWLRNDLLQGAFNNGVNAAAMQIYNTVKEKGVADLNIDGKVFSLIELEDDAE